MIVNDDVFNVIKKIKDNSISFIFSDPPYNLGTQYIIDKQTGKPTTTTKAVDFMKNKWDGLTCEQIEIFCKESYRICKHGAFMVLYGMDRVQMPWEYFACLAGFIPQQYLYSYKISNFPKSLNISKAIDKNKGLEREVIGKDINAARRNKINSPLNPKEGWNTNSMLGECPITAPNSDLAKKYDGFFSGNSLYKQVLESILVFRKPYETDMAHVKAIYEYENGNKEIHPSIINIDDNRVPFLSEKDIGNPNRFMGVPNRFKNVYGSIRVNDSYVGENGGRFPSQLFIVDDEKLKEEIGYNTSDILDKQSGNLKSGEIKKGSVNRMTRPNEIYGKYNNIINNGVEKNKGGCSKILHKCQYTDEEYDILLYSTRVFTNERDMGCGNLGNKKRVGQQGIYSQSPVCETCNKTINGTNDHSECVGSIYYRSSEKNSVQKNNHPTLKSLELDEKIVKLYTPPRENIKDFKVFNPFSGTGSEYIGILANGISEENIIACELNSHYYDISLSRIKFWKKHDFKFKKEDKKDLKKMMDKNKKSKENKESLF